MSEINLAQEPQCSECKGTHQMRDPFGGPEEMLPCTCQDQAELKAAERRRDELPFGRAEFQELIDALERAAVEHQAEADKLKVGHLREWEKGAAFGYRTVVEMFREKLGERRVDEQAA